MTSSCDLIKGRVVPVRHLAHEHPFQTQAGRVYDTLRDMIFARELKSGEPVPLEPTAERLGVSVTPLRDALRTLCHQGLIEQRRRFGYRVVRLTVERVEGYEVVREALFVQAARRAAERITEAELAELYPLAEKLDAMIEQETDSLAREDAERRFHHEIARIADCVELEKEMARLGIFGNLVGLLPTYELHPHKAIVDALASRDPRRADDEMRLHCGSNRQALLDTAEALEAEGAQEAQ